MEIEDLLQIAYENDLDIDENDTIETIQEKIAFLQKDDDFFEEMPVAKGHVLQSILDPLADRLSQFLSAKDFCNFASIDSKVRRSCFSPGPIKIMLDKHFNIDYKGQNWKEDAKVLRMIKEWKKLHTSRDRRDYYWKIFDILYYGLKEKSLRLGETLRVNMRNIAFFRLVKLIQSLTSEELKELRVIYKRIEKGAQTAWGCERESAVWKMFSFRHSLMVDKDAYENAIKSGRFRDEFRNIHRKTVHHTTIEALLERPHYFTSFPAEYDIVLNNIYSQRDE